MSETSQINSINNIHGVSTSAMSETSARTFQLATSASPFMSAISSGLGLSSTSAKSATPSIDTTALSMTSNLDTYSLGPSATSLTSATMTPALDTSGLSMTSALDTSSIEQSKTSINSMTSAMSENLNGGNTPILSPQLLSTFSSEPSLIVTDFVTSNTSNMIFSPISNTSNVVISPISELITPYMLSPSRNDIITSPYLISPMAPTIMTPTSNLLSSVDSILFSPVSGLNTPQYIPSLNISHVNPTISSYYNLNADPRIHKKLAKYFYFKTKDDWLKNDLNDLLGYVVIKNNTVQLISKLSEYDKNIADKESSDIIEKKITFLVDKKYLSQRDMLRILIVFIDETNSEWITLPDKPHYIKKVVRKEIARKIKKDIK
jgi:hypothetical protein